MSNQTDTSALERALDYLGAVEVAPGRYAYQRDSRYLVASTTDMVMMGAGSLSLGRVMPAWWRPERREAWRMTCDGGHVGARDASERFAAWPAEHLTCSERITADLETGDEVPA